MRRAEATPILPLRVPVFESAGRAYVHQAAFRLAARAGTLKLKGTAGWTRVTATYVHHRISAAPRRWQEVADSLVARRTQLAAADGVLYGVWRSQIGRPRDELTAVSAWPREIEAGEAEAALAAGVADIQTIGSVAMTPTLRPADAAPPLRQGNYAFRWFITPDQHWDEFLALCAEAWPGFEAAYDSQVIGLWRCSGDAGTRAVDEATGAGVATGVRSLLLTRRPNLAMWERSKLPQGAAEAAVRDTLSRRYDLCTWTTVHTTTLLTATDSADRARWT